MSAAWSPSAVRRRRGDLERQAQLGIDWTPPPPSAAGIYPAIPCVVVNTAAGNYAAIPAARSSDPDTSHDAADAIAETRTAKQLAVLAAFARHGAMTAKECERLEEFETWAPSTVRKRCSELQRMGFLVLTGQRRNGCREYARSDTGAR